jgi:hypothetical protein
MKKLILFLLIFSAILTAGNIRGSFRSGLVFGTGAFNNTQWEKENTSQINYDYPKMRVANQLRLSGKFGGAFFKLNGLHTIRFAPNSTETEPKLYETYFGYKIKEGEIVLGRVSSFNRWYWGSFDGARLKMNLSPFYRLHVAAGLTAPYGKWFESDNSIAYFYGHLDYLKKHYGLKIKANHLDETFKAGMDAWAKWNHFKLAADFGFDLTNSQIADAGFNGFYQLNTNLSFSANYRLMRSLPWQFSFSELSIMSERVTAGVRYHIDSDWYVALKQTTGLTKDYQSYVTHLLLGAKHIYFGFNYTSSNYDINRLGLTLGGRYEIIKGLHISGALSPVNYQYYGYEDKVFTLASNLRLRYQILDNLALGTYWALYNDLGSAESIPERYTEMKVRGQVFLNVNF